jgi:hypothetical protein
MRGVESVSAENQTRTGQGSLQWVGREGWGGKWVKRVMQYGMGNSDLRLCLAAQRRYRGCTASANT